MDNVRRYYYLTKPGIIYGNLLTGAAGYLLGSAWHVKYGAFLGLLAGMSLVIASACVVNNYMDRDIDKKMARTSWRALAQGKISGRSALLYASLLGAAGVAALVAYTNWLTLVIGLIAYFDYVVLYGWGKRHSVHGTLIGSLSGSAPIVAGYTAATNRFDGGALLLFLILTFWQMPHFYAIALYRQQDYKKAKLPVLPLARSARQTEIQIYAYILAFTASVLLMTAYGYAGYTFLAVMGGLGLVWLWRGYSRRNPGKSMLKTDAAWGKQMFLFSLIVITALSFMTAIGGRLP